jgi:hypothetical protein
MEADMNNCEYEDLVAFCHIATGYVHPGSICEPQTWAEITKATRSTLSREYQGRRDERRPMQIKDYRVDIEPQLVAVHNRFEKFVGRAYFCQTAAPRLESYGIWLVWFTIKDIVIVHRPTAVHLDRDSLIPRLHRDDGPAFQCLDQRWWYIRGVEVPQNVVEQPLDQTLAEINTEQNSEVKRIRIERYGWSRYLRESDARVIDRRRNYVEATAEALMALDRTRVLVCACPSTGRVYCLEVPAHITTCESAQSWLWGDTKFNIIGRS